MKQADFQMNSFCVDKDNVAQTFFNNQLSYDDSAVIQKALAFRLAEQLHAQGYRRFAVALEAGCGTGNLTCEMVKRFDVESLYLNDLVSAFYQQVKQKIPDENRTDIVPFWGDIETLDIVENLDVFISGSTLQWLHDPVAFIEKIVKKLAVGGVIAISFFTEGTLKEVKDFTGVGLDYSCHAGIGQVLARLTDVLVQEKIEKKLYFKTVKDVLYHIKKTGVGGVRKNYRWTRKTYHQFEQYYEALYVPEKGLPMTYVSSIFIAEKKTI